MRMRVDSNFYLGNVIDVQVLQDVQDKFAELTGIAFVTVDFKGKPITKRANFCEFCKMRRKIPQYKKICYQSDAYGGLEAAIRERPYIIYRCPTGLVDFAIPIVVEGQYLGAVLCGQIRSNINDLPNISNSLKDDEEWKLDKRFIEAYNKTVYLDFEKIEVMAELVHIVVNQLVEKSMVNLIQEELNTKSIKLMEEQKARIELEKELKISELKALQSQINPHFLFNVLNSIGRLALIEEAQRTEEMVYSLAELLRHVLKNTNDKVTIREDIKYIEKYLKIQSMRFGNRVNYKICIEEEIEDIKIPVMILQPFIENAISHGLEPSRKNGKISIEGYSLENDIIIKIVDNGVGISKNKLALILEENDGDSNIRKTMGIGIHNTNRRLINYFGKGYKINIKSKENMGTTVKIKLPKAIK
jgi:ligand-binding sensor protein/anti-sigma regulatory factor (Ser/Thr protein kinase)